MSEPDALIFPNPGRRRPREQNPRKRSRQMKMFTGTDTMPLFVRVDIRAYYWLEKEAKRTNVSMARLMSRILLKGMEET
jgi:hypothetical protein